MTEEKKTEEQPRRRRGRPPKNKPAEPTVTAEVKETKKDDDIVDITVDTKVNLDASLRVKPGDKVFLRYRGGASVKIGALHLHMMNQCDTVPEDIGGQDLAILDALVRDGSVIVGEIGEKESKNTDPPESRGEEYVRDWYVEQLDKGIDTLKDAVVGITKSGVHISGWHPKELLRDLIQAETHTQNRPMVINFLSEAVRTLGTVSIADEDFDPKKHASRTVTYNVRRFQSSRR